MCTYDQNPCILPGLDLKSMIQRLEGCPKGQSVTRCFNKAQGLGLVSAMQLVDELILGIAALTGGGSYPGHVVTGFEAHTIRSDLQDGSSAIIPDDMETLGSAIVVISTLSAIDCHLVLQWLTWRIIINTSSDLDVDRVDRACLDPSGDISILKER